VCSREAAGPEDLEDRIARARRAIVLGVGGGGDVVGTLPVARALERLGVPCVLGGLSWERFVHDPRPGTRRLEEMVGVEPLAAAVGLAGADAATRDGVRFAESEVAAVLGERTLLVDLSAGVAGVVEGLRAAARALGADLLVGIDAGGDSLADGTEPGLRSPLADAMMLAAFTDLAAGLDVLWGVVGYGSDGELTSAEIDARLARVAGRGGLLGAWGVTPAAARDLERLTARVRTEASAVVLAAARGALGSVPIRDGSREVQVSPVCTVTFLLDPCALSACTPLAGLVRDAPSLEAASAALLARGIRSEYEFEKEMQRRGLARYPGRDPSG